ncbi:MAG: YkgJ family cysteine cluster protein [Halieaceae bacterium]
MNCRPGCGACCIAASINSPLPGMPQGKPAGVVCVNLDPLSYQCQIWGTPGYPSLCAQFHPAANICGDSREEAIRLITELEIVTR